MIPLLQLLLCRTLTCWSQGFEEQPGQVVETVGLHIVHIGNRNVPLQDFTATSIVSAIRAAWQDVPHPFQAILAKPPPESPTRVLFIVEFIDEHRPPVLGTNADIAEGV